MKRKSYKITFALGSGYSGSGKNYSPNFAEKVIEKWMANRLRNNLPTISGFLHFGKLFFPAKGRRNDKSLVTMCDTGIYTGELSSADDVNRKDKEIKETLNSLAKEIKTKLKQEKVYIIYKEENWFI